MLEDGKISYKSTVGLIITTIAPTAILYLPTMTYLEAKQDGWISVLVITVFGIVVAYMLTSLGLMYKNKTIIQYSSDIVGKIPGKIIGLIFCCYFIHINAVIIREFAELLSGPFMPETPMLFFIIGIILPSIYGVYKGFEVIVRTNRIIFPIFMLSILAILLYAAKDMDFRRLQPVFAEGMEPVLVGAYRHIIWFSETVVITMFIPYIDKPSKVKKMLFLAVIIVGLLGVFINISIVTTFGGDTLYLTYPYLSLARYVSVGFVERLDSIIMFMWIGGVFIKIAVFHYCAVLALAQWLEIKDYRVLSAPVGVVLVILSFILWGSLTVLKQQITYVLVIPYIIVQVFIPLLLFVIAKIKKKVSNR